MLSKSNNYENYNDPIEFVVDFYCRFQDYFELSFVDPKRNAEEILSDPEMKKLADLFADVFFLIASKKDNLDNSYSGRGEANRTETLERREVMRESDEDRASTFPQTIDIIYRMTNETMNSQFEQLVARYRNALLDEVHGLGGDCSLLIAFLTKYNEITRFILEHHKTFERKAILWYSRRLEENTQYVSSLLDRLHKGRLPDYDGLGEKISRLPDLITEIIFQAVSTDMLKAEYECSQAYLEDIYFESLQKNYQVFAQFNAWEIAVRIINEVKIYNNDMETNDEALNQLLLTVIKNLYNNPDYQKYLIQHVIPAASSQTICPSRNGKETDEIDRVTVDFLQEEIENYRKQRLTEVKGKQSNLSQQTSTFTIFNTQSATNDTYHDVINDVYLKKDAKNIRKVLAKKKSSIINAILTFLDDVRTRTADYNEVMLLEKQILNESSKKGHAKRMRQIAEHLAMFKGSESYDALTDADKTSYAEMQRSISNLPEKKPFLKRLLS